MILCIGGTDNTGGAGLDQDRRTAEALGCPVCTAVTAVTVQGREGVSGIEPVSSHILRCQIELNLVEKRPLAIKTGALVRADQVSLICDILSGWKEDHGESPIIVDPVFSPTRGMAFLKKKDRAYYGELLSLADVVTPNREELEILAGCPVETIEEGERAAWKLVSFYDVAVILTGGHFEGRRITEKMITREKVVTYRKRRRAIKRTHGTGCALATALAVSMSRGRPLEKSFARATRTVSRIMG